MKVLLVGGAGYIGSHMVKWLGEHAYQVVTLDNLSTGHADAVVHGELVVGDIADTALLDRLLAHGGFDAVLHFAAFSLVEESMRDPGRYYRNNVANTVNLLEAMVRHGVRRFIFSSSATIFGEPQTARISEDHPRSPEKTPMGAANGWSSRCSGISIMPTESNPSACATLMPQARILTDFWVSDTIRKPT